MGYILEVRAGDLATIHRYLTEGTAPVATNPVVGESVAQAIAAGEAVTADPQVTSFLIDVFRERSWWWGSVQHSSSGGTTFRTEIADEIAPLFGRDFTMHLLNRPILDLVHTVDHPMIGWVDADEVQKAVARAESRGIPETTDQSEILRTLLPILHRAAELRLDLFGLYV